jgi:dTMP kinase
MPRGQFIAIEGIEGVGKSTQFERLASAIEGAGHPLVRTREPGGTPVAERIREVVLGHAEEPIPPMAELLLMFAARAVHLENLIRPALDAGRWVLTDRFIDASRAYQGGGRGISMAIIDDLAGQVLSGLEPDLVVLLDAPVETAMARIDSRGSHDRMDSERADFYRRVREKYLELAARSPERFVIVDASGDIGQVGEAIDAAAAKLLGSDADMTSSKTV